MDMPLDISIMFVCQTAQIIIVHSSLLHHYKCMLQIAMVTPPLIGKNRQLASSWLMYRTGKKQGKKRISSSSKSRSPRSYQPQWICLQFSVLLLLQLIYFFNCCKKKSSKFVILDWGEFCNSSMKWILSSCSCYCHWDEMRFMSLFAALHGHTHLMPDALFVSVLLV